ncbi:MAG: hypothetical protein JWQ22_164 [Devosia sp.]|nr:hypothetical protein [Devosia sp.]
MDLDDEQTSVLGAAVSLILLSMRNGADRVSAHALLDAALDLAASGSDDGAGRDGRLSQAAALTLARLVANWLVPEHHDRIDWHELADADPAGWREAVVDCLRSAPLLTPPEVLDQLMFGLMTLDDGSATPSTILSPAPKASGKGSNPASRRAFEQALHAWIAMEKARGRPATTLRNEVARAVGRTVKAVDMWLLEWRRRDGPASVALVLKAAYDLGRGRAPTFPVSDEIMLLRLCSLPLLAAGWRHGVSKES